MKTTKMVSALLATSFMSTAAFAADVTITIESWRNDDLLIWQDTIIPAFEAENPGIKVVFAPTAPAQYNSALNAKLEAGTAGDMITCRPFDGSLSLFDAGHLAEVGDLENMANFGPVAKSGWSTDDGSATFCVPMASVIHGFIYNKEAFEEVGLEVPGTVDEFFAALDAIKEDGNYIPLSMGTADQWEAATMGYANIGPNYWKGEEGRLAVIAGDQKLTDPQWVAPYAQLARWGEYMGDGYEAQSYPDSQNLFTLGRAAIYPAGSWELSGFNAQADFEMGAFNAPVQAAGDECYISDHVDIALGMNKATEHADEVRTFLNWVGSAEFASMYANSLPGFFSLSNHAVEMSDPLAQEIVGWRDSCNSSIRP
ncbi:MAG: ABC transporter substrate-binding protein, partial [Paracoccaceae bacterium]|nr:ABC transporter substrate-binding protein [Paracoccaceae bacterium]